MANVLNNKRIVFGGNEMNLNSGYEIPLIIISDYGYEHILGNTSHDTLYIDKESGGIQFLGLQCCQGTKKMNPLGERLDTFFVEAEVKEEEYYDSYNNMIMVSLRAFTHMLNNFPGFYSPGVLQKELNAYLDSERSKLETILNEYESFKRDDDYSKIGLPNTEVTRSYLEYVLVQLRNAGESATENKKIAMWLRNHGCKVLNDGQKWLVIL